MPTTPNYGWDTPANTDYVTNGALSIRTLGDDIDATVYSIQTTLDAGKVDLNGDTMTGPLVVPTNTAAGRALGVLADASADGIIQFLNAAGSTQNGSIRVNSNNYLVLSIPSNSNAIAINNVGEIIRSYNGTDRPQAFAMECGTATVAANSNTTVTLSAGRFTQAPIIMVTPNSVTTAAITYHSGTSTTSNFKIYNTSGTTRDFFWQAIQMRSASAAG